MHDLVTVCGEAHKFGYTVVRHRIGDGDETLELSVTNWNTRNRQRSRSDQILWQKETLGQRAPSDPNIPVGLGRTRFGATSYEV